MINNRRTLAGDLVYSLIASVTITSILAVGILYYISNWKSQREFQNKSQEYISYLNESLALPLWNFDSLGIEKISDSFFKNDFVAEVLIADSNGEVLAHLQKKSEEPTRTLAQNIYYKRSYVGKVTLSLTPKLYQQKEREFLLAGIIILLSLIFTLVITMHYILQKSLIRPIRYIMDAADQIGSGNYELQKERYNQREVREIISKFQDMAQRVSKRESSFKDMNSKLNREIQEKEQTQKALRESEQKFSIAFSSSPDAMVILAADGSRLIDANDVFLKKTGIERDKRLGMNFDLNSICPDLEGRDEFRNQLRTDGKIENYEMELTLGEEGSNPYLVSARIAEIWRQECVIIVARDIRRLKTAQEESRKYERIVSTSADLMAYLDLNGVFRAVNEALISALMTPRDQLLGRSLIDISGIQISKSRVRDNLETCLRGEEIQLEQWLELPGLGRRYFQVHYYPDMDKSGTVVGAVINARDVTRTKQLESNLVQAKKMEAIGTLAAGVAHDFNNILQVISGNIQLLSKKPDVQSQPHLEEIQSAVNRAADLIQSLLAFGRKNETGLAPVDIKSEVMHTIRMLERTLPKMIGIKAEFSKYLPPVKADANQINLVLMNLGANASDAMPDGGELIFTARNVLIDEEFRRNYPEAATGDYVRLTIRDTGCGMDQETQKRIFDPFYTTKEIGKGAGLGLFMVYGVIKNHGGFLTCNSRIGKGTEFNIYLPAITGGASVKLSCAEAKNQDLNGSEQLLLVDDEPAIAQIAGEYLSEFGYLIDYASSGEEALEKIRAGRIPYNLVVLDLGMPGMGGLRALEEIIQFDEDAKVLVASGYTDRNHFDAAAEKGAVGFLSKPYKLQNLLEKIRAAMDCSE